MNLYLDCNEEGVVRGEGIDYVGPWILTGQFSEPKRNCVWNKSYVNRHSVYYEGLLGENGIVGVWNIKPFLRGRFHIWPNSMPHLYEQFLRAGTPIPTDDPIFESLDDGSVARSGLRQDAFP